MARRPSIHDRFFKQLFARPALVAGFCAHYLPRAVAAGLSLDPEALTALPTEFGGQDGAARRADAAYRVPRADGSPLPIYLLLEHKSRPELLASTQIARYCMAYWEQQLAQGQRRLSPILPVLLYHGARPWRAAQDLGDLVATPPFLDAFRPRLRYHLVSLGPGDPPPRRGPVSLQVGLAVLQAAFSPDFATGLQAAIARLAALRRPELIAQDLAPILMYANQLRPELSAEHLSALAQAALPQWGGTVMDKTFETLIQQGRKVGLLEGWQEGLQEGRQEGRQVGLQEGRQEGRQVGLQEGRQEGRQVGLQEGRQEGRQVGLQEGRQEGLNEGLLEGLHEALSLGIELKFGPAGLDLLPRLRGITDLAALRRLRQALPGAGSLAEFGRLLAREGG